MKRILFALSLIPTLAFAQPAQSPPDPVTMQALRDELVELETAKASWRVTATQMQSQAQAMQAKVSELEKTVKDKQAEIDTLKQPAKKE